jgi:hypothetical protein
MSQYPSIRAIWNRLIQAELALGYGASIHLPYPLPGDLATSLEIHALKNARQVYIKSTSDRTEINLIAFRRSV